MLRYMAVSAAYEDEGILVERHGEKMLLGELLDGVQRDVPKNIQVGILQKAVFK